MADIDTFVAKTTRHSIAVFAVAIAVCLVIFFHDHRVAMGLILGFAVGLTVFRLKAKAALASVAKTKKAGTAYLVGHHYLNLLAYGLVLGFAFKTGKVNGFAALLGLLIPNAVMITSAFFAPYSHGKNADKK